MQSPDSADLSSDPEVLAARGEVLLAKAELENRLHAAGDSGRRALARMARKARPVLVVAAVLVGVVVVVRVVRAASRSSRSGPSHEPRSGQPSLLGVAFGALLRGAVRVMATRVAEEAVARLAVDGERGELDENETENDDRLRGDGVDGNLASTADAK